MLTYHAKLFLHYAFCAACAGIMLIIFVAWALGYDSVGQLWGW